MISCLSSLIPKIIFFLDLMKNFSSFLKNMNMDLYHSDHFLFCLKKLFFLILNNFFTIFITVVNLVFLLPVINKDFVINIFFLINH